MKKLIFCLVLPLALCLSACGGTTTVVEKGSAPSSSAEPEALSLELEKENSVADWADFTLVKLETTPEIRSSLSSGLYYKNDNAGETYIDVVIDITNTSSAAVDSDDLVSLTAVSSSGTEYSGTLNAVETDSGKSVSAYEAIAPLSTVRMHCAVSVPDSEDTFALSLTVNDTVFACDYTLGDTLVHTIPLSAGAEISVEDYVGILFQGTSYTDDLLPSNLSGFYTHYAVDDPESTYLAIRFDITNLQSTAKDADTFVGAKVCYQEKYVYTGFLVVEEADGSGFNSYESLDPLVTRNAVFLIEVPKSVMDKAAVVTLTVDGQEYTYDVTA